jgi:selenocysteine lyase/cysteine desulfurase
MARINYLNDFGPFNGQLWLNSASEGAIPKVSAEAARQAVEWKLRPFELTLERFAQVPKDLKVVIGQLMNVDPTDVILGNSATYGIHLLANGLPLQTGDEILLMQNDFPSDILPWLGLQIKGIVVRQIKSENHVLTPDEISAAISPKTRVVCLPHVHTFSGHVLDIQSIGKICHQHKIIFIVNMSQSLGNRAIDVGALPVDAITTAAFKWLCGPYGTGFCWMRKELRESLNYNQAYWCSIMRPQDLIHEDQLVLKEDTSSRRYDVFGTANFFNFYPLTRSVQYLLDIGLDRVERYIDQRVCEVIDGLKSAEFNLISLTANGARSALVVFSHKDRTQNLEIFNFLKQHKIHLALWKGNLRVSPHIFITPENIRQFLTVLSEF